jgi:hypothetical protein
MRKGHPIRMQKDTEGTGLTLLVHPEKYDHMTRTFSAGKSLQMSLHPEEIAGSGLGAGSKFKSGIAGIKTVAELVPLSTRRAMTASLNKKIEGGGSKFKSGIAGIKTVAELVPLSTRRAMTASLNKKIEGGSLEEELNEITGQKMGALRRANVDNFRANEMHSAMAAKAADARVQHPMGYGVRTHRHKLHEVSSVGVHGNLLGGHLPAALQSQPYSENFQWGSRLPVAYQHNYKVGGGLFA